MSSERVSIFFTGATGYVGGAVLSRLLQHPDAGKFDVVALVRNAEKARVLESKFGVKTVVGSLNDYDEVQGLAEKSHLTINTAASDDVPVITAILSGLRSRHDKTGDVPIFIHTSGTGVLMDSARGEYPTETIYSDMNVEQLKSIPDTAIHRNVECLVVEADEQGYVRSHIILPSTVYAIAKNPLVDAGIANAHSVHIPLVIRGSLDRKRAGMVGKGKSIQSSIHIDDTAGLFIALYDAIINKPEETGHGWEGFYFGESGDYSWYQVCKAIGNALVALGVSADSEPTSFTVEELVKYFGAEQWGWYSGSNSRCRGDRARAIGWNPEHTGGDLLQSIHSEVETLFRKNDWSNIERQLAGLFF